MEVFVGAQSNAGRVRDHNEDSFYAGRQIWGVADGMGGQAAGDMASTIVTEQLRARDNGGPLTPDDIWQLIAVINDAIVDYAKRNPLATGLGSTLTGVASVELDAVWHWSVFNVGDSRVYRYIDGRLQRETVDHNEAEELITTGQLTREEAVMHPSRFVLTRALGTTPPPQPDVFLLPQTRDETFLICSDGLTSEVPEQTIEEVLRDCPDPGQAAERLIDLTMLSGAHDNVTAVVLVVRHGDGGIVTEADGTTIPRPEIQEKK